jgi:peptidoglycan/xylan/chitin deacetylase (PgdA/CDA1 family)
MSRAARAKVAILSYHKIGAPAAGGWETWYYVPESIFEQQLRTVASGGFEFIDLPRFYRGLEDAGSLPAKSALVTFDDGYRNNLTAALPVMRRLGVPGVVFVPTEYIGRNNGWDYLKSPEPEEMICTWDELRELERGGVMIESHSASHPSFSTLSEVEHERELREAKEALEMGLGRKVEFFAYPYGDAGLDFARSQRLLEKVGYRAACLYGGGVETVPGADRWRLQRLAMGPDSDLDRMLVNDEIRNPKSE